MKAITLWQPWASLVAVGAKTIETRYWSTSYRGPLAIHAAKRIPDTEQREGNVPFDELGDFDGRFFQFMRVEDGKRDEWEFYDCGLTTAGGPWTMPLGAVVATCELIDVVPIEDNWGSFDRLSYDEGGALTWLTQSRVAGRGTWDLAANRPYGDFTPGRYAWLLDDIAPLDPPQPARGLLHLWEWAS